MSDARSHRRIVCFVFISLCMMSLNLAAESEQSECLAEKYVFEENAQARFALMMSLRKADTSLTTKQKTCSLVSRESLQNLLAVEWTLNRLNNANNGTGYINNVTLGFVTHDDCREPVYAARNALSFSDPWLPSGIASCSASLEDTLHYGIIGPSRSSTATRVASLFRDLQMPMISMAATSAELSNKTLYPTFLRTAASDQHQMTMIADILHQLSWTYVVVVYENDEYGSSGARILEDKARERHICIHRSFPLPNDFLTELGRELYEILQSAKNYSLGVVFIGSRDKAEQFLWMIDQNANDQSIYGLHFIFTDGVNVDTTIFDHKEFGQGTLAVGPSGIFLEDLYTDLQRKYENVKSGQEKHRYLEAFIKESGGKPLLDRGSMNSFIPLTVHAVLGVVHALKLEHDKVCSKGMPGVCPDLLTNVERGDLLDTLYSMTLYYNSMPVGVPPDAYRERGMSLSFDHNGDMRLVNGVPTYTVYQFDKKANEYNEIGSYTDGVTAFNKSDVKMLTPKGDISRTIPTSVCRGRCDDTCKIQGKIPLAYLEGDAYILGIVSMHDPNSNDPFACGPFRTIGSDAIIAEGFLFAVKELRRITGINFGAIALDDCYSSLRSTSLLSDFFSGLIESDSLLFPFHFSRDKLVGVMACRSSGCTIPTAAFFMPLKIPVVSYAASSPDLDDKVSYPYFLRTVPSDLYQAQVMLDVVKAMGWEYVGLMYVKNNYGSKGMQAFKNLALREGSGVCPAPEVGISETQSVLDSKELFDVWLKLVSQKVKVVVFFGIDSRYRAFLSYLEAHSLFGKFIFLGSEDWGNTLPILQSGPKAARGSITLKVESMGMEKEEEFKAHLRSKQPSIDDANIWFSEFWQNHFKCNFKGGFINEYSENCDPNLRLSDQVEEYVQDQRVVHAMNAVFALGLGIRASKDELCEEEFPCKFLQQYVDKVLALIKSQTRKDGSLDVKVFGEDGNGAMGFDVYNVQQSNDQPIYVKVGTFNSKEQVFLKENLRFYTDTGMELTSIESKCTTFLCSHCPKPSPKKPDTKPQMGDNDCELKDFRVSDVLIISLIIVLILAVCVAIAVLVLWCSRKYNTLSKKLDRQKEDEIYAVPETRIYQGDYLQTHGMVFANLDADPYRLSDDEGQNRAQPASRSPIHRDFSNPSFINDRVDSVSQVIQADAMSFRSQPNFQGRSNTISGPASHFSAPPLQAGRSSMPVSYIGPVNGMSNAHDNPAFTGSSTDLHSRSPLSNPASGLSSGPSSIMRLPGTALPMTVVPWRSTDGTSVVSDQTQRVPIPDTQHQDGTAVHPTVAGPNVVYYMQGPDGQLTAQMSPQMVIVSQAQGPGTIALGSSVRSNASSVVNPDFGPYSLAVAQKQQSENSPVPMAATTTGSPIYVVDPNGIELQQMHPLNTHRQNLPIAHHAVDPPTEYSPIHYASPSKNHNPQLNDEQLQHPYLQQQHKMQQLQNMQQQVVHQHSAPQTMPERNSLNASIPDIVGQLSELSDHGVMESVDLASSRESLDDIGPQVKVQVNGRAKFTALDALGGNASRV